MEKALRGVDATTHILAVQPFNLAVFTSKHGLYLLTYRTRRSDNNQYLHINNSVYYHLFDSIVNTYLIEHCALTPSAPPAPHARAPAEGDEPPLAPDSNTNPDDAQIGLAVASHCAFFAPLAFPQVLALGLRVTRLGASSVDYEVGVSGEGAERAAAVGGYTHVFVGRAARRPAAGGMREGVRKGLARLCVGGGGGEAGGAAKAKAKL